MEHKSSYNTPSAPADDLNLADLDLITNLAHKAGEIAMDYFGDEPKTWMKPGNSPVSEADLAVDTFLKKHLMAARPDYGWLSEETEDNQDRMDTNRVFIVDPIDGTRGFLEGATRWCISVAVVELGRPVCGVLDCPAMQQTITASVGHGTKCNDEPIVARAFRIGDKLRISGARQFQFSKDKFAADNLQKLDYVPSLAYRLAMVALGEVDLAMATIGGHDWDVAAADIIVQEAGGILLDIDGNPLQYNLAKPRHRAMVGCHAQSTNEMLDLARLAMNKPK